ncbi:GGDEF domain-containing protein [bacterium]|nr:GGDEF domain-containing protein [bacterium]
MKTCPFCSHTIDESNQLVQYYLSHEQLIESINLKHPQWNSSDGACLTCLERFYQEFSAQKNLAVGPEEPTIVATSITMVDKQNSKFQEACLIMIHGPNFGKQYHIHEEGLTIGRSEKVQVQVFGENVSRKHARIIKEGDTFIIEDLNSTNGTFINTRKISKQNLEDGDLILVGNNILKFIYGSNTETQYYEEMYRLATKDGLTQAYNKVFFLEKLNEEFRRSQRYSRDLSLIMLDLDHFSIINNQHGHVTGDSVLKIIAKNILANVRKEDIFGRYGGEEFALLLPEINSTGALTIAEKIRRMIESIPFKIKDNNINITLSAGIASVDPDMKTSKDLIEKADKALYDAKHHGRNNVKVA